MVSVDVFQTFLDVVNEVKKTALSVDIVAEDAHLSGELGVDSREMLEIWYELEKKLGIEVADSEKRDLYTAEDVIQVLSMKLNQEATA